MGVLFSLFKMYLLNMILKIESKNRYYFKTFKI